MSVDSNFSAAVTAGKVAYTSYYEMDKVVDSGTVTYTVAAGAPQSFPPYPTSLKSIPNTYGSKAFVKASWSIDGTNFNSSLGVLQYYSGTYLQPILKASVNCGSDASNIYFFITNNYTTSLTYTINYAVYLVS